MVKLILLSIVSFFLTARSIAQIKGVTETGDEVFLYSDGTWKYSKDFNNADSIKTNPVNFKKNKNSSFLLKSQKGKLGFWLDPKKWTFKKALSNAAAEFEIELKGQSLQATIITEASEIPLEAYVSLALQNGKAAAPDLHITKKEYRKVNDLKVLYLQMDGTQSGIKFTFSGYYFSDTNITVQFVTYTYRNMMPTYSKEIEELLNGLVELELTLPSTRPMSSEEQIGINDPLPQGALSPNNNCKPYFPGSWKYNAIDAGDLKNKTILVERTLNKTTEFTDKKYSFEYDTKWINNCNYDLTFRKTTKPNYKLIKTGEVINVEITYIDKNVMNYRATFHGKITDGEMVRNE